MQGRADQPAHAHVKEARQQADEPEQKHEDRMPGA